jgi:16S rRNA C1402 N4-methylase RsmH
VVDVKRTTENAVSTVHRLLRDTIGPGDVVIDATVGNGWDTHMLAQCVGSQGCVYGFDVQQVALDVARVRLQDEADHVKLILAGHETMRTHVEPHHHGQIRAISFNLGYLPGGEKSITTLAATTVSALRQALELIMPGGLITIVCYSHAEGRLELQAVQDELAGLEQERFSCLRIEFFNQQGNPPVVFAVYATTHLEHLP